MIHLRTLGSISLRDETGVELRNLLTQPKRFALLVYLASASAAGRLIRRDSLVAMFWPESDDEKARNALRQAVHFIKHTIGSDIFASRGADDVGLVPAAIALDAATLDGHAAAGRHADAVALYAGEFLQGFSLRGAPAFDAWVESERTRLRKRAADSAWLVTEDLLAAGNTREAREMGTRALALSGDDEAALRRFALIEPLTYGTPPIVADASRPTPKRWRGMLYAAAALVALFGVVKFMRPSRNADAATDPNRMLVLPFVVRGPESLRYLEDGLPILLDTRLDAAGTLRTVDARALIVHLGERRSASPIDPDSARTVATKFGAGLFVLGSIVGTGPQLRLTASLYDRAQGTEPIAHAEVDGAESDLVNLVDKLAVELLAARFGVAGGGLSATAARTTSSLPALKAWLAGEAAITAGRYVPAMVALREAIASDSMFAMAHFRLAVAANWSAMPQIVDQEAARAVALSDRMSPSTRLVLRAFLDLRHGNYTAAAAALRSVVREQPSATEAWYELGEALFHGNPSQGRALADARVAFENALRLDPHNFSAAIHLSRIAASQDDTVLLQRVSRAALDSNPDGAQRAELYLLRALALRDDSGRRRFLAEPPSAAQLDALWRAAEYSRNLTDASGIADSLAKRAPVGELRSSFHFVLAHLALGRERFDDAARWADSLAVHAPQSAAVTRLLLATHPALPASERSAQLERAVRGASPLPAASRTRALYIGASTTDTVSLPAATNTALARLALGDSASARKLVASAARTIPERLARARVMLALANDHAARVTALREVAELDSLCGATYTSQSAFAPRALLHLAVARALADEGRVAEAAARLRAVPEDFGFNLAYLAEVQRRRTALLAMR